MSTTRTAKPGSAFRQERFSSSPEFKRGLMANLVAQRSALLVDELDRAVVWFLQLRSHRDGGLNLVAQELLERFPEQIATRSMLKFGAAPGQVYNADQVRAARAEIPDGEEQFPLQGEQSWMDVLTPPVEACDYETEFRREQAALRETNAVLKAYEQPSQYPAQAFQDVCKKHAAAELSTWLAEACLNPALDLDQVGPWYFPKAVEALRQMLANYAQEQRQAIVVTQLGEQVFETLEYSWQSRCLTIIDGMPRTGKTHAAKAWCELHPGIARYVQVPSTNDEIGFYRAIAKSLGVSINLNSKAQDLRQRIEETLQAGHLILVLDEAHYLWPNLIDKRSLPARINWVMTALVNHGVPVCLVTTPQFSRNQKAIEAKTRWTSEQFIGRIGHYQKLPDALNDSDIAAIAQLALPEADADSVELLVTYAKGSARYIAAIEALVCRARFMAGKEGRTEIGADDLRKTIKTSVIPSDNALAQALLPAPVKGRSRATPAPAVQSAPPRQVAPFQSNSEGGNPMPRRETGLVVT